MDPEKLEQYWRDPAHWTRGLYYRCREDPRVIVPKQKKWSGWTLNFAQPLAFPVLILMMVFVGLPPGLLIASGHDPRHGLWWVVLAAILATLCIVCAYAASPGRFKDKPKPPLEVH